MVDVYITDLAAYNKGFLIGKWVALPHSNIEEEIARVLKQGSQECADELGYCEEHEEYFITDWEWRGAELFKIGEYENLSDLNEKMERLELLDGDDSLKFKFLIEDVGLSFEEALNHYEEVEFYKNMDLSDVAWSFVEDGIFGDVNPRLECYIDFEKLGRALEIDGYVKTWEGVFHYAA